MKQPQNITANKARKSSHYVINTYSSKVCTKFFKNIYKTVKREI